MLDTRQDDFVCTTQLVHDATATQKEIRKL